VAHRTAHPEARRCVALGDADEDCLVGRCAAERFPRVGTCSCAASVPVDA
jgi:hypothetical protein